MNKCFLFDLVEKKINYFCIQFFTCPPLFTSVLSLDLLVHKYSFRSQQNYLEGMLNDQHWLSTTPVFFCSFVLFLRFYLFLERGEGREKESMYKRYIDWLPLTRPPTGDLVHNPGMCPDWESNQRRFGLKASTQSTEPHQPGLLLLFLITMAMPWCSYVHF